MPKENDCANNLVKEVSYTVLLASNITHLLYSITSLRGNAVDTARLNRNGTVQYGQLDRLIRSYCV